MNKTLTFIAELQINKYLTPLLNTSTQLYYDY